jgi:hypothetical protein
VQTLEIIGRFVLDVVLGVIGFCLVGAAAWLLGVFVKFIDTDTTPRIIIYVLTGIEYLTFAIDAIGFVFLLIMSSLKFMREVWRLYNE